MGVPAGTLKIEWIRRVCDGSEAFRCSNCGCIVDQGKTVAIRTGYKQDPTMFCEPCVTPKGR